MKFSAFLSAFAFGALVAGSAVSADLPARPVPMPVPAFTWTGFYSGIELGGIRADFHRPVSFAPALIGFDPGTLLINQNKDLNSAVAGSRGGYLQQFGMFVVGIEGGTQVYSLTTRRTPLSPLAVLPAPPGVPAFLLTDRTALHSGWQSSVRGRFGVAWDRFMLYATGGVSFTTVRVDSQFAGFAPGLASFVKDRSLTGYTAGVGGEWAITDATSIGVEYRHTEYDRSTRITGSLPFGTVIPISTKVDFSNDAVMLTYNVRFGRIFPQFDWRL